MDIVMVSIVGGLLALAVVIVLRGYGDTLLNPLIDLSSPRLRPPSVLMARIARFRSGPAPSRHPARQPARARVFRRGGLWVLSRLLASLRGDWASPCWSLLPDAEPCPSDPDPADAEGLAAALASASALFGSSTRGRGRPAICFRGALVRRRWTNRIRWPRRAMSR